MRYGSAANAFASALPLAAKLGLRDTFHCITFTHRDRHRSSDRASQARGVGDENLRVIDFDVDRGSRDVPGASPGAVNAVPGASRATDGVDLAAMFAS